MFDYVDEWGMPSDYHVWRTPMLAATGSCTPSHQGPNGVGTVIHCYAGYKLFFVPINPPHPPIVQFDGIDYDGCIGWDYLFHPPYRYGAFILSPGETVYVC